MPEITNEQLTNEIGASVEANVGLAQFSTFKLGGPAEWFVRVQTAEVFRRAVEAAVAHNLPYTILGGGANVLIADKGIAGLVIKAENNEIVIAGDIVRAGAGAPFAQAAVKSAQASLTGLEFSVAIPGSVGGAVRGNAGCYGWEVKDVLARAHGLRIVDKTVEDLWLENKDCRFSYRESRFKHEPFIILEAEFKLKSGHKEESLAQMKQWLDRKKSTQSVESNCAGCVFKNVPWSDWEKISPAKLKAEDIDDASSWRAKGVVPTGWIVEQLGLKGYKIGEVMVSEKHGNFLLNMGQTRPPDSRQRVGRATAEQMVQLISYIKMQVRDKLGIQLREEVQYLGFNGAGLT